MAACWFGQEPDTGMESDEVLDVQPTAPDTDAEPSNGLNQFLHALDDMETDGLADDTLASDQAPAVPSMESAPETDSAASEAPAAEAPLVGESVQDPPEVESVQDEAAELQPEAESENPKDDIPVVNSEDVVAEEAAGDGQKAATESSVLDDQTTTIPAMVTASVPQDQSADANVEIDRAQSSVLEDQTATQSVTNTANVAEDEHVDGNNQGDGVAEQVAQTESEKMVEDPDVAPEEQAAEQITNGVADLETARQEPETSDTVAQEGKEQAAQAAKVPAKEEDEHRHETGEAVVEVEAAAEVEEVCVETDLSGVDRVETDLVPEIIPEVAEAPADADETSPDIPLAAEVPITAEAPAETDAINASSEAEAAESAGDVAASADDPVLTAEDVRDTAGDPVDAVEDNAQVLVEEPSVEPEPTLERQHDPPSVEQTPDEIEPSAVQADQNESEHPTAEASSAQGQEAVVHEAPVQVCDALPEELAEAPKELELEPGAQHDCTA